jgi:hypothetical protein
LREIIADKQLVSTVHKKVHYLGEEKKKLVEKQAKMLE